MGNSKYNVDAIRNKLKQQSGNSRDPDEFRPEKPSQPGEEKRYKFFVLPPLQRGETLKSGTVEKSMDNFFIRHGNHWINQRPHPCPRIWDGSDCKLCDTGFDMMRKYGTSAEDKKKKSKIREEWMPNESYVVNIFFPDNEKTPEELRGTVKYFRAGKQVFDEWQKTIMRDGPGDPDNPEAYGVFFDENAAFMFELRIENIGGQNSYKQSRFLPSGGNPVPMIKTRDGDPHTAKLEILLSQRHNLWEKLEEPNIEALNKVFRVMMDGDDDDDDNGGFDQSDSAPSKPAKQQTQQRSKPPVSEDDGDDEDVTTRLQESKKPNKAKNALADEEAEDAPFTAPVTSKTKSKPAPASVSDDDAELDDLMSQLSDD